MKKTLDETGLFFATEQRLPISRSSETDSDKQVTYRHRNRRNKKAMEKRPLDVQEDNQEIIKHKKSKQSKSEEQGAQEVLVEQGDESQQQQQETGNISH